MENDSSVVVRERDEIIAEKTAQDMKAKALAVVIKDAVGFGDAQNFMNETNAISKRIEAFRKEKVKPFQDAEKEINKTCKAVSIPLDEAVDALEKKTSDWKMAELEAQRKIEEANRKKIEDAQRKAAAEQAARDEAARKAREAQEEAQRKADEAARMAAKKSDAESRRKLEAAQAAVAAAAKLADKAQAKADTEVFVMPNLKPIQEVQTTTRSETGTATYKEIWKGEVIDVNALPEGYYVRSANQKAINAAVDGGIRNLPGVRIYKTMQVIKHGA